MRFCSVTQKQRLVPPGSASELAVIIARKTGHRPETRNMVAPPPSQFQAKEKAPSPDDRMIACKQSCRRRFNLRWYGDIRQNGLQFQRSFAKRAC